MSAIYTQATRILELTTPLAPDTLLLRRFSGGESISSLFAFRLALQSQARSVDPAKLVGKRMSVSIALDPENTRQRHFNGIVSSFTQAGTVRR